MEELDAKQLDFLKRYLDKTSSTYSNAYQSAIDAGYSKAYAGNITVQAPWLVEILGSDNTVTVDEIVAGIKAETTGDNARDRLKAWELLAKYKQMFVEKVDITSKGEQIKQIQDIIPDELDNKTNSETTSSIPSTAE